MKQLIYFTLFLSITLTVNAQVGKMPISSLSSADSIALNFSDNDDVIEYNNKKETNEITPPIIWIDGGCDITCYPDLLDSMMVFVKNNLTYPDSSKKAGIEGTVYVSFCFNGKDKISEVNILKGLSPDIDKEVLRVFSIMPNWEWRDYQPKKVRNIKLCLPVKFTLDD